MQNFFKKQLDSQSKTLFKNSSWVFLAGIIGAAIAFVKAIIIARGLGAEWFGIFTVIIVFIGTLQETMNLNLGAALIRFGSGHKALKDPAKVVALIKLSLVTTSFVAVLSVSVISIATIFYYESFIKLPGLSWFAVLYAIAAAAVFFNQISRSTLRLYYKFKINSMIQIIMDVIDFIIIAVTLYLFPGDLKVFLIAVLIARFINGVIPNVAAYRELLPEFKAYTNAAISLIRDEFREIRLFVIHNSIAKTLQALIKNGDVLLIAFLTSDPLQVAYYTVGKKVAFSILTLTDPLVTSIYPQLCDLYNERKISDIKRMLIRLSLIALVPSAVFFLFALFFNEWVMVFVFGEEYRFAGKTFYLLTAASLIYAVLFWIQPLLQAINLLRIRLNIYLTGIITGAICAYFLIPLFGSTGMAYSVIIMNILMPCLFIFFAVQKLNKTEATSTDPINRVE